MMKYPSLLFILGLISLCFREIINMNSSIQNQFKICKKLKEEVPSLNLNCRELLRKQIEESNSLENISLNENLELLKNKRTDISLLELTQESIPLSNKIFNTKKEIEKEQHNTIKDKNNINDNKNNINNNVKDNDYSNNNFDFIKKKIENTFNNNNNNNIKEEENLNNESYDENLHNLHRIEKIENILGLINGNVNFINLELKSIKNSLIKKRKTNFIKQKKNRIYQDDRINNAEKVELITSEAVLREIEKLKTGQNNNSNFKNKNLENENHERENNKKDNSNFKKTNQDTRSLLQIKSFNDLHIDLNSLGKNKNAEKDNNNNNKNDNKTNSAKINKDNKQMQDLNDIIEGFKKKQASEERNIDKKKFHKQVTLNDKEEKLEANVNNIMELLNQLKVDNEDLFSQIKSKIASSDNKADN